MIAEFLNSNFGTGMVGVIGVILGAVAGVFGERWMRSWGEVRCVLAGARYELSFYAGPDVRSFTAVPEDLDELEGNDELIGPLRVRWTIDLRFFNDKDEATGLHAVSVAFVGRDGGEAVIGPLADPVPGRTRQLKVREEGDPPDYVDLPSRLWAPFRVEGQLAGQAAFTSVRRERVEVRAEHPDGKSYVREIDHRRGSRTAHEDPQGGN